MNAEPRLPWRHGLGLWLVALILPLGGALWLCPGGQCTVPDLDVQLLTAMRDLRGPIGDALASGWTWLGSILVLAPLLVVIALGLARAGRRDEAIFVVGAMGGAVALCQGFKYWVQRPGPACTSWSVRCRAIRPFPVPIPCRLPPAC